MNNFKYSSKRRLRTAFDYKSVYTRCKRVHYPDFILRYKYVDTTAPTRVGVVVSKKSAAKAVDRNRIKRVVRECFRVKLQDSTGLDIILTAKANAKSLSRSELAACVNQILDQFLKSS